ncbi:MAG TPA: cytidylate kinase-like family protein [Methylococcaceae bacterium]|nr:cytidylate kinase-like family protein [Methylococcaceae bacterium]
MAHEDPQRYVEAIITHDVLAEQHRRKARAAGPLLVTLSRDHGALGEIVAAKLGLALDIPVLDREILVRVAEKTGVPVSVIEQPGEHFTGGIASFMQSLIGCRTCDLATYRRALFDVILDLAHRSALLVGCGAHLILQGKPVFRLRIVGTPEICAARLAAESGETFEQALEKVRETNASRARAIHSLFHEQIRHCGLECAENFDLVVNTDHMDAEGAVAVALAGLRQAGLPGKTAQ